MTVEKILNFLNEYCPFELAEEWDHAGLNVGRKEAPVKKVLVALDADQKAIDAAIGMGADLLLTHHPMHFDPPAELTDESLVGARMLCLAENRIAHIAVHTNLDAAAGGVNDRLADLCGLSAREVFCNIGRMGALQTSFSDLAERLKAALPTAHCQGVKVQEQVKKIALVGGSGGSLWQEAAAEGCDTLVTGEAKYHQLLDAREGGINVLVLGHYETEYPVLAPMAEALKEAFPALVVELMAYEAPMERF